MSVWDVEGREYQDWLAGYSAVNQGHCHPRIVRALQSQAERLTLVSRAFHSDQFAPYAELLTRTIGFERVLPMNTGAETGETALKLARRWAYDVKGVPADQALMIYPAGSCRRRGRGGCRPPFRPPRRRPATTALTHTFCARRELLGTNARGRLGLLGPGELWVYQSRTQTAAPLISARPDRIPPQRSRTP